MRSFLLLAALLLTPAIARADQCALNDKKVAEAALAFVKPHTHALEFCEPCRERAPGKPFAITKLAVRGGELLVNGSGVDLAYLYVETAPKRFENVGLAVGCGASGVSKAVHDGKPTGPVAMRPQPTSPSRPPSPPGPSLSNLPRATGADELVGTWTVKVTTWLSTCPVRNRADETWWIDLPGGKLAITTSENTAFEGMPSALTHGMFQHSLQTKQQPSSGVLKLSHSLRDRFYGQIVRGEPTGNPADPVCVVQLNVSGTRQ